MDEAAIEERIEATTIVLAPPDLDPQYADYLIAFHDLSPSRRAGMALGAIPITEIRAYRLEFGFDEPEIFFRLIRALDGAYLTYMDTKPKGS